MMEQLFVIVLNMSITAGYIILAILLIRPLLCRAPKGPAYFLWALPFARLVCPVTFESSASLVPSAEAVLPEILYAESPSIHTGLYALNSTVNPALEAHLSPQPGVTPTPLFSAAQVASIIWMALMGCMLLYGLISCLRLYSRLRFATRCADGAWETDRIDMPLVFGLFRPRIYLPVNLAGEERAYILEHERTHIRHGDHIMKFLSYLVLTVHCFNPLVWLFYMLMGRDMEMRCDEAVLRRCGLGVRTAYSHSLLTMAARRSDIVIPLAFGESGAKSRVKNILRYKKPALWVLGVVAALGMILAVFFLTNPVKKAPVKEALVKEADPAITIAPPEAMDMEAFLEQLEAAGHTDFLPMACREVTPAVLHNTPYRIYKFTDTFASYLFYEGEAHLLGGHFGGWGLVAVLPYSDGLLYTYSWGSGLHRSHIGWFDAKSKARGAANFVHGELDFVYYGGDMLLEVTGPDTFDVYAALFEAVEDGQPETKQGELLGSIRYEQDVFRFDER